jgi:hypothetical protein
VRRSVDNDPGAEQLGADAVVAIGQWQGAHGSHPTG